MTKKLTKQELKEMKKMRVEDAACRALLSHIEALDAELEVFKKLGEKTRFLFMENNQVEVLLSIPDFEELRSDKCQKIERLRKALEFYAKGKHYFALDRPDGAILYDHGQIAQEALENG